jgi:hypothetical protein
MKLSSRKQLLKESELTLKSIKKSLNEDRIAETQLVERQLADLWVKGKIMPQEPKEYVVRCHTKPSKWVHEVGYGKNMKVGYYLMYEGRDGNPGPSSRPRLVGTDDINKAHVFRYSRSFKESDTFGWYTTYTDDDGVLGDYFEPVPVEVIVKIK